MTAQLRVVFNGESRPVNRDATLSARSRLSDVYHYAYRPIVLDGRGISSRTVCVYEEAVRWWVRLVEDPPLDSITEFTTSEFVRKLLAQKGRKGERLSIATVRKHCTQIAALLSFAGPRERRGRGRLNRGLLDWPPVIESPRDDHRPPAGDYTLDEIRAIHAAAATMTTPSQETTGVAPGAWWQAIITVAFYTALRRGPLFEGLRYSQIHGEWATILPANAKGRRGKRVYLRAEVRAALESIRTDRDLVFEFPNWPRSHRWVWQLLCRICERAGLPKTRWFGWHGFRRAHATLLADAGDGGRDGVLAAQLSLGHSSSSTTLGHYVAGRVQDRFAQASIQKLPTIARSDAGEGTTTNGSEETQG